MLNLGAEGNPDGIQAMMQMGNMLFQGMARLHQDLLGGGVGGQPRVARDALMGMRPQANALSVPAAPTSSTEILASDGHTGKAPDASAGPPADHVFPPLGDGPADAAAELEKRTSGHKGGLDSRDGVGGDGGKMGAAKRGWWFS